MFCRVHQEMQGAVSIQALPWRVPNFQKDMEGISQNGSRHDCNFELRLAIFEHMMIFELKTRPKSWWCVILFGLFLICM